MKILNVIVVFLSMIAAPVFAQQCPPLKVIAPGVLWQVEFSPGVPGARFGDVANFHDELSGNPGSFSTTMDVSGLSALQRNTTQNFNRGSNGFGGTRALKYTFTQQDPLKVVPLYSFAASPDEDLIVAYWYQQGVEARYYTRENRSNCFFNNQVPLEIMNADIQEVLVPDISVANVPTLIKELNADRFDVRRRLADALNQVNQLIPFAGPRVSVQGLGYLQSIRLLREKRQNFQRGSQERRRYTRRIKEFRARRRAVRSVLGGTPYEVTTSFIQPL